MSPGPTPRNFGGPCPTCGRNVFGCVGAVRGPDGYCYPCEYGGPDVAPVELAPRRLCRAWAVFSWFLLVFAVGLAGGLMLFR